MIFLFLKLHKKQICVRIRRKPGLSRKSEIPLKFKELHVSLHLFACIGTCKVFFDELGIIIGSPLGNLHPASTAIHAHPFFTLHPPHPPSPFTIHSSLFTTPQPHPPFFILHTSFFIPHSPSRQYRSKKIQSTFIAEESRSQKIQSTFIVVAKQFPKNLEHIIVVAKPLLENLKRLHRGGKTAPKKFGAHHCGGKTAPKKFSAHHRGGKTAPRKFGAPSSW